MGVLIMYLPSDCPMTSKYSGIMAILFVHSGQIKCAFRDNSEPLEHLSRLVANSLSFEVFKTRLLGLSTRFVLAFCSVLGLQQA